VTARRQLVLSIVATAALLASAATPVPTLGVSAIAQPADGKGPSGARRTDRTGKASSPPRTTPPTVNSTPAPKTNATPQQSGNARTVRPGDGDRRRSGAGGDRRRGTRYVWGPGLAFYFYDGFYHGDCSWLRRKARETGSRYWRHRYEQCRNE